jgi:hypothetical protein
VPSTYPVEVFDLVSDLLNGNNAKYFRFPGRIQILMSECRRQPNDLPDMLGKILAKYIDKMKKEKEVDNDAA